MKIRIIFLLFTTFSLSLLSQNVSVNIGVNTDNKDIAEIINLWKNYLNENNSLKKKTYWNKNEVNKYDSYDLLKSEGYITPSIYDLDLDNLILSITREGEFFKIKSAFYWIDNPLSIMATTVVYCKKENGTFKLYNNLNVKTKNWETRKIGLINYHFQTNNPINDSLGEMANQFYLKMISTFDLIPKEIEYYTFSSCSELEKYKGFDYVIGDSPKGCGFFDKYNYIIYSSYGEYHLHEIVHVINNKFPNAHPVFLAGISALWGGHFGKEIEEHYKRLYDDVTLNKIDLSKILGYTYIDENTSPIYVYGAIFCKEAIEKGGVEKLSKLFSYGKSKEE